MDLMGGAAATGLAVDGPSEVYPVAGEDPVRDSI